MSSHVCCGFSFILQLADPLARVGHATPLQTSCDVDIEVGFKWLMAMSRDVKPSYVFYNFLSSVERWCLSFPVLNLSRVTTGLIW